jgi:hypothetical protein
MIAFLPASRAGAQTANAGVQNPPKIIQGCYTETLAKLHGPCEYWIRNGDSNDYDVVATSGTAGVTTTAHLIRFDRTRMEASLTSEMKGSGPYGNDRHVSGTIKGNQIDAGDAVVLKTPQAAKVEVKPIPWTGWFFYPPAAGARSGQAAFLSCGAKMSTVNIGDHSVVTTDLKLNEFQAPQAMTVSADGKTVYASTNGQTATFYPAKLVVVDATAGLTRNFDLKNSMPIGFLSLALAGDGVTLYGAAQSADGTTSALVAMDANTGAILAKLPYRFRGRPSLVMAGDRVVLADGSIPGLPPPKDGAVAVFGSSGDGVTALPDGQHLCVRGKTVAVDPKGAPEPSQACGTAAGGSAQVAPGTVGRSGPISILGRFRTADEMLPGTKGVSPDGKWLFLTFPPTGTIPIGTDKLAVADAVSSLITDVVGVCDKPSLLAMPPVTR